MGLLAFATWSKNDSDADLQSGITGGFKRLFRRRDRVHASRYTGIDGDLQDDLDDFPAAYTAIHRRAHVELELPLRGAHGCKHGDRHHFAHLEVDPVAPYDVREGVNRGIKHLEYSSVL